MTAEMHQIADFNPGKDFDGTFSVNLLGFGDKEEFIGQHRCCQVTCKCDENGMYWKNSDKFQFRFRYLHLLGMLFPDYVIVYEFGILASSLCQLFDQIMFHKCYLK